MGHTNRNIAGAFKRTNRIVNQINKGLLHLLPIKIQDRDVTGIVYFKIDARVPFSIERYGFFNNRHQMAGNRIRAGKTCKRGKFIHQIANHLHLADDGLGTLLKYRIIHKLSIFSFEPLCGKGYGSQGIFNLMGDSPRDFTPGRHALTFFQFG